MSGEGVIPRSTTSLRVCKPSGTALAGTSNSSTMPIQRATSWWSMTEETILWKSMLWASWAGVGRILWTALFQVTFSRAPCLGLVWVVEAFRGW